MTRQCLQHPIRISFVMGAIMVVTPDRASAITVEVARKCEVLTTKAFPPKVMGNPAAGIANGTPLQRQNYFSKCVANKGNEESDGDKPAK